MRWGKQESIAIRGQRRSNAYLSVLKLNQPLLIHHNLVPLVLTRLEQFRQRKPLPRHLIPIVRVHKLVVVHAVGRVALYTLDRRLAVIQRDDVVNEGLAGRGEFEGFAGVGGVVLGFGGLAGLEVLAREGGVVGHVRHIKGGCGD